MVAGQPIENLRAQVAIRNPPYHLGRKLLVSRNNIAQATRFTVSLIVEPGDIPANEWLIRKFGGVAETVLEWWKHDIDDEGREWITKRTIERLVKLHERGLPLELATIYPRRRRVRARSADRADRQAGQPAGDRARRAGQAGGPVE